MEPHEQRRPGTVGLTGVQAHIRAGLSRQSVNLCGLDAIIEASRETGFHAAFRALKGNSKGLVRPPDHC